MFNYNISIICIISILTRGSINKYSNKLIKRMRNHNNVN